jgi:hypothetical protein
MVATVGRMADKKKQDRHKPSRMVRIPEVFAAALEGIAAEEFNKLTDQVKIAIREYLERKGRLPKPTNK